MADAVQLEAVSERDVFERPCRWSERSCTQGCGKRVVEEARHCYQTTRGGVSEADGLAEGRFDGLGYAVFFVRGADRPAAFGGEEFEVGGGVGHDYGVGGYFEH